MRKYGSLLQVYAMISLGCVFYALAFDWFYAPNHLTCGGLTGVAQVLRLALPGLPVGMTVLGMNLPLFYLGFRQLGARFLLRSLFAMALSSVLVDLIAALHSFSPMHPLAACICGGAMLGLGDGLMMGRSATTGGTELAAWLVQPLAPRLSLGKVLLGLDLAVILVYAAAYRSVGNAAYGCAALVVTTAVLDVLLKHRQCGALPSGGGLSSCGTENFQPARQKIAD